MRLCSIGVEVLRNSFAEQWSMVEFCEGEVEEEGSGGETKERPN